MPLDPLDACIANTAGSTTLYNTISNPNTVGMIKMWILIYALIFTAVYSGYQSPIWPQVTENSGKSSLLVTVVYLVTRSPEQYLPRGPWDTLGMRLIFFTVVPTESKMGEKFTPLS